VQAYRGFESLPLRQQTRKPPKDSEPFDPKGDLGFSGPAVGTQRRYTEVMVNELFTPKLHRDSGIFLFRKRVPERLKAVVGKTEIKFSLHTRDPVVARIRNLEEMARLARCWAELDGTSLNNSEMADIGSGRCIAIPRYS
jgi:hypothetical protein